MSGTEVRPPDSVHTTGSADPTDGSGLWPALHTERLVLRPLTLAHRSAFLDAARASRARLDRTMPLHLDGETDEALFERQVRLTREGEATRTAFRRVAFLSDGTLAGAFNLVEIRRGLTLEADVNWWLAEGMAGKGLAQEALQRLIRHAFDPHPHGLGLLELHAGIHVSNSRSRRLAERLGFEPLPGRRVWMRHGRGGMSCDLWIRQADAPEVVVRPAHKGRTRLGRSGSGGTAA